MRSGFGRRQGSRGRHAQLHLRKEHARREQPRVSGAHLFRLFRERRVGADLDAGNAFAAADAGGAFEVILIQLQLTTPSFIGDDGLTLKVL